MRARAFVVLGMAGALVAGACSNSSSPKTAQTALTVGKNPTTTANAAALKENVPRPGVKGVTSSAIRVAVITSTTNAVGGKYAQLADGIQAYFDRINDAGGIYGRKLEIVSKRDDNNGLVNDQMSTSSLADDNAFAVFEATLQMTGADTLAKANEPTFTWNINPEFASTPTQPHLNFFSTVPALCFTCPGPLLSWIALQNHFTKVGIIGYGVSSESKEACQGTKTAFQKYGNGKIKVAFFDDTVGFAADLTADVARMKSAGVQFVTTCMDTNEVVKLQKEMDQQGLHAVQDLPNAYDHDFLKQNGTIFQGAFVQPDYYPPWESTPQSPLTQQYLSDVKKVTNDPVEVTQVGYLDAIELVDALKGAGPEFTQAKVIDWMNGQTAYDAQGMIQPINWTTAHIDPQANPNVRLVEQCQPIVEILNSKFVPYQNHPGKPWPCFDATKGGDQTPTWKSFAPGGVG
ncbi:MAG TPA: ABC transporter substrate-binding protein [Acidimicrobiia bacterium]|jgi:ABC-type branched-subunit amino acid transport system substrate-binding protein